MMMFAVVAALLIAAALLFVVPPLWIRAARGPAVVREQANLSIYRDQMAEIENDLRNGTLSQDQYEQGRAELERRLLEETTPVSGSSSSAREDKGGGRATAIGVMMVVPLLAVLIYLTKGTPEALSPEKMAEMAKAREGQHGVTMEQIESMVAELAARLEQNPQDVQGWVMLGRSYAVMGRYPAAVESFAQAAALAPDNPDVLTDYADTLAMASGQSLSGEPEKLIQRALQADPRHQKGLWLAGTVAFDKGGYDAAIAYWERLLAELPEGSQEAQSIIGSIAEARAAGGRSGAGSVSSVPAAAQVPRHGDSVAGMVSLSPALAQKASPEDTVFVFARPPQGSRMPLAILRAQVKDLPLRFALDDSMAMMPSAKISGYSAVTVGARISRSGAANAQSGDLEGMIESAALGSTDLTLVIDRVVP